MTAGDAQRRVQTAVDRLVAAGEVGLQVAVVHRGRTVVDAVGGIADARSGAPVGAETLFFAASTAKGVASAVAHVLVERGRLAYDTRVADVWPEFGAHGKDGVTLRHVLMHTAGVPAPPHDTTVADLCDWDQMCAALAVAEPWWPPGTRFGDHAQTFGYLLGEVVRRTTGHTLAWWLRTAITGPLGVTEEVHLGVPPDLLGRVAHQEPAPGPTATSPEPGSPVDRALPPGIRPDAGFANDRRVLTADIPSGGTVSARGAAQVYARLLGRGGDRPHRRRRLSTPPQPRGAARSERAMDEPVTELDERFSEDGTEPTPWARTCDVLESAQLSWVTTVRADGRPHVTPLVAVWLDGALHFTTGPGEQKAVNLAPNPDVVIATGCNDWDRGLDVMVEGRARPVTDRNALGRLAAAWAAKWDGSWRYEVTDDGFRHGAGSALVFAVEPTKVLAFGKRPFTHTRYLPAR